MNNEKFNLKISIA